MDSWERFDEISLPDKEAFYSKLNLEYITDKDYVHVQKVWEVFEIRNLVSIMTCMFKLIHYCLQMYLKTLEIEIYGLDPAHFLSAPGLAWQASLKKTRVKLEILTDYDMLLLVEDGNRGGMCQVIHRYAKANNKYMNNCDKSIISSHLMY